MCEKVFGTEHGKKKQIDGGGKGRGCATGWIGDERRDKWFCELVHIDGQFSQWAWQSRNWKLLYYRVMSFTNKTSNLLTKSNYK